MKIEVPLSLAGAVNVSMAVVASWSLAKKNFTEFAEHLEKTQIDVIFHVSSRKSPHVAATKHASLLIIQTAGDDCYLCCYLVISLFEDAHALNCTVIDEQ